MTRAIVIILAACWIAGVAIADKSGPGTKAVKTANDTIADLLKQKANPDKVTASVRDFIDLDELGKRALADHWDQIKPAEQGEYQSVLRSLIEANYIKGVNANVDYRVEYTGESPGADHTLVVTTVVRTKRKGRPLAISVDYTLVEQTKGKLRVVDISTDGVGLVANYRAQFNKIIAKDGMSGLLLKMKKKLAESTSSGSATKTSGT